MNPQKKSAFTLVELIVVITILAILGTIAYVSFSGYSQDARNSSRISDIKNIEKALSIYATSEALLPPPDDATDITYSWSILWSQWVFSTGAIIGLQRISEIPTDPKNGTIYSYSLAANQRDYQIWWAVEWWLVSYSPFTPTAHAISWGSRTSYTVWNYIDYDLAANSGGSCSLVTIPSLILSDIPTWWVIQDWSVYTYSYKWSEHIPNSYESSFGASFPGSWFQTIEILDNCDINTLADLELYIAQLSTAFQQLAGLKQYERIIFYSNSNDFKLIMAENLKKRWFNIAPSIIEELSAPLPSQVMVDTFTDTDTTQLVWSHTPDSSSGSWSLVPGGDTSAYTISSNTLSKNGWSNTLVFPSPDPSITQANYEVSFDIQDFASGEIHSYLRYTDSDNYYRLSISPGGYTVMRRALWVDSVFANITESISIWSSVVFSISWDTLSINIAGVDKGDVVGSWITGIWNAALWLQNSGASIDNYTITYK